VIRSPLRFLLCRPEPSISCQSFCPDSDRWVILCMFVILTIAHRVIASPDLSGRGNLIAKLETAMVGLRNLA